MLGTIFKREYLAMTQTIIPDRNWYIEKSKDEGVPAKCPYAHHKKCPRYWETTSLLMEAGVISGISQEDDQAALQYWKDNQMLAELDEDKTTAIRGEHSGVDGMYRACPEVIFKFMGYYSDNLYKYVDDIDRVCGHKLMEREGLQNSWRSKWMFLQEAHYLDCEVYNDVQAFITSFVDSYHPSIKLQITRMDRAMDAVDVGAALHAVGSAIEVLGELIAKQPKKKGKSTFQFRDFEQSSNLPKEIKEACKKLFILRGSEKNAGHGHLEPTNTTFEEAVVLVAFVKAVIEIEYKLMDNTGISGS